MAFISAFDAWESLYNTLNLSETQEVQQREMENAFYAGFMACFEIVVRVSNQTSEDKAVAILDGLKEEIDDWVEKKERGL